MKRDLTFCELWVRFLLTNRNPVLNSLDYKTRKVAKLFLSLKTSLGWFCCIWICYNRSPCSVNTSSKFLITLKSKFSLNETRCVSFEAKNDTSNANGWKLIAQKTTNEKLPGSRSGHYARVPPANTYID